MDLGDRIGCQGLNPDLLHARQAPCLLYYCSSPRVFRTLARNFCFRSVYLWAGNLISLNSSSPIYYARNDILCGCYLLLSNELFAGFLAESSKHQFSSLVIKFTSLGVASLGGPCISS